MRNFYGWSLVALACMTGVSLAQATRQDEKSTRPGAAPTAEGSRAGRADETDRGAQSGRTRDTGRSAEAGRASEAGRSAEAGRADTGRSAEAGRTGASSMSNQQIAALIHGGCRNEIEISKFALERLKSPEAKQFAEKMISEHQAGCEKVAQIAGSLAAHSGDHGAADATRSDSRGGASGTRGTTESGTRGVEGARREGREGAAREGTEDRPATPRAGAEGREDQPRGTATVPGSTTRPATARASADSDAADTAHALAGVRTAGTAGSVDWVSIHKQMADQCLSSTRQELGRYQGDDFDKAYMGQQLVAHMKMADELKVLRNHATGELKQEIEKGLQMANAHLEEARRIMHKEKDEGSTTNRQSNERASREGASTTNPREGAGTTTSPREGNPRTTPAPRGTTPAPRNNP